MSQNESCNKVSPRQELNNNWPLFVFADGGSVCRESPAGGAACLDASNAWDRSHDSRLPGRERHFRQGKTGSGSSDFNRSATNWWVSLLDLLTSLFACFFVCLYVHLSLFVCMSTYLCLSVCPLIFVCLSVCPLIFVCLYVHLSLFVCLYVHLSLFVCMSIY
jgi:hypothetical protein